jgi:hypothetical protein
MASFRILPGAILLLSAAALLGLLHGCQEQPQPMEPTDPDLAAAVAQKTLVVKGSGNGSGLVSSSPSGISCRITAGTPAATGCTARFNQGTVVTLTTIPNSGHAFRGWSGACIETGSCQVSMTVGRNVNAKFLKGPFTLKITSGTPGAGSGTVTSQAGLSPVISCVITNGTPARTGCSAKYPAGTSVTLTASPGSGFDFAGWDAPCSGTGTCQYVAIQNMTLGATFRSSGPVPYAAVGRWEPPIPTQVIAIHMNLLPTGKVLLWGQNGQAQLWDPAGPGAGMSPVTKPYEVFCSGHTLLPDGRLMVVGGHISLSHGLPKVAIFDPGSERWSAAPPMVQGRWYPTATTLPNGDILVVSGNDESKTRVTVPEVWNGSGWRRLTTASLDLPYYPWMFVAPNGKIFLAGSRPTARYLDVSGTGQWTTVAERTGPDRYTGSAVMYAPGKILYAGGGAVPTASAEVIDLNHAAPTWRNVAAMAYPRRHMMSTILADGSVLVTHGTSGLGNDQAKAVRYAERWDPVSEAWATMAREPAVRTYHAAALLLPDGRVLSGGSGEGAGVTFANSQFSAQVFTPPYLFDSNHNLAQRPSIISAPSHLSYGQSFSVESQEAGTVSRGTLIRLSSVTHWFNQSQLIYPLSFTATGSSTLTGTAPPSGNLAPPGPYMLFLINGAGVPSVAKMVTVGP